jgi:hypothetical protein
LLPQAIWFLRLHQGLIDRGWSSVVNHPVQTPSKKIINHHKRIPNMQGIAGCFSWMRKSLVVPVLAVIVTVGCGGGGGSKVPPATRVDATGQVEFNGEPVPAGTVTFINKASGAIAVCPISNGTYTSERKKGPVPGPSSVTVVGKESAEGAFLWKGGWPKQVEVDESGFSEDFSIASKDVKPDDGKQLIDD